MTPRYTRALLIPALLAGTVAVFSGCEAKGPAERTGEKIDNAARQARDTVNPPAGPVEAAGRKIDDAAGRAP